METDQLASSHHACGVRLLQQDPQRERSDERRVDRERDTQRDGANFELGAKVRDLSVHEQALDHLRIEIRILLLDEDLMLGLFHQNLSQVL